MLHFKPTEKKTTFLHTRYQPKNVATNNIVCKALFLRGHRTRQRCSESIATIAIQIYQGLCPLFKTSQKRQLSKLVIYFLLRALQPRLA